MNHHYWEWPIATYLFLGGLGGGIFTFAWVFISFLMPGNESVAAAMAWPVFIAILCLAFGCFLLVFELGQPLVFLRVFFNSITSIIGHGARILSVCLIFGFLWFLSYIPWEWFSPLANFLAGFRVLNIWLAGISGAGIMLYTGILLSSLKAHSFWATPALPVLFTVSALSTACAAITLSAGWWPSDGSVAVYSAAAEITEMLHATDIVLVIVELIVLNVMVLSFLGAGNNTAHRVALRWVKGSMAPFYWVGMICLGLVCPFLLYLGHYGLLGAILVLCGGLLLRFLVVYSDDRAKVPGEERYFNRLPKGSEEFISKWTYGENIY